MCRDVVDFTCLPAYDFLLKVMGRAFIELAEVDKYPKKELGKVLSLLGSSRIRERKRHASDETDYAVNGVYFITTNETQSLASHEGLVERMLVVFVHGKPYNEEKLKALNERRTEEGKKPLDSSNIKNWKDFLDEKGKNGWTNREMMWRAEICFYDEGEPAWNPKWENMQALMCKKAAEEDTLEDLLEELMLDFQDREKDEERPLCITLELSLIHI